MVMLSNSSFVNFNAGIAFREYPKSLDTDAGSVIIALISSELLFCAISANDGPNASAV